MFVKKVSNIVNFCFDVNTKSNFIFLQWSNFCFVLENKWRDIDQAGLHYLKITDIASQSHTTPRRKRSSSKPSTSYEHERYSCNQCGRNYKWRKHLTFHIRHMCGTDDRPGCPLCGKRYTNQENMLRHIHLAHKLWI